jgi:hypothetical protein
MSSFVLSQIIIAIALLFDVSSFQFKERRHLIFTQFLAALLISAHFFVLDRHTAGAMFALSGVRLVISLRWQADRLRNLFLSLSIAVSWLTYSGHLSVIGCTGNLLMTAGSFAHSNARMRLLMISGSSVWLIHNILAWTPVGIFMEVVFLTSGVIGYHRFVERSEGGRPAVDLVAGSCTEDPATTWGSAGEISVRENAVPHDRTRRRPGSRDS